MEFFNNWWDYVIFMYVYTGICFIFAIAVDELFIHNINPNAPFIKED